MNDGANEALVVSETGIRQQLLQGQFLLSNLSLSLIALTTLFHFI